MDPAAHSLPWEVAIDRNKVSDEDRREVENAIVFFIVGYATLNRGQREPVLTAAVGLWGNTAHILELYGVWEFLEDVDRDRQYWRDHPCTCERRAWPCQCDRGRETVVGACRAGQPARAFRRSPGRRSRSW